MKNLSKHLNSLSNKRSLNFLRTTVIAMACFPFLLISQDNSKSSTKNPDEQLINQYVDAKGPGIISFDASNIKQFWIDNTVVGRNDKIEILMNKKSTSGFESAPLKIQLANVFVFQDCKVEIISETSDYSFSVLDSKSKVLSTSSKEQEFLNYSIMTSVFHLENASDLSFYLRFASQKNSVLSIKKIILSFPRNNEFLSSPGRLAVSPQNIIGQSIDKITPLDDSSFTATGKWFEFSSKKRIVLSSKEVSYSLKIKNTGDEPTHIYVGYAPYTKEGKRIIIKNNIYKKNTVMKVVSSEENSNKILVDLYPDWIKDCHLALNAKEDLSDFPNSVLVEGKIVEVKKLNDEQTEITFDKPIKKAIEKGTQVRIQFPDGYAYLYMHNQILQPGEEVALTSEVAKDENFLEYSPKAFCRGTYYVIPVLISHSINRNNNNTIQISEYTLSY